MPIGHTGAPVPPEAAEGVARGAPLEHWLLRAALSPAEAWARWEESGVAWLRPGDRFGAVALRAALVHAALGLTSPMACVTTLDVRLGGGPVFYRDHHFGGEGSYTMLIPAGASQGWRAAGAVTYSWHAQVEVPAPEIVRPEGALPWWVVPPGGPDALCDPEALAALAAQGHAALEGQRGAREVAPRSSRRRGSI
ncbi:hypothetical protein [Streptomyces bacillaris]|uniref:hypothetical protein n=1 Tax=Streptomyces bacillaris TaxID=68179 RepID=UPI0036CE4095